MKSRWGILGCAAALSALLVGPALAVPTAIQYTGELTAENGLPYTGAIMLKARVFDAMSDGNLLTEEDLGEVLVQGGVVEADLMSLAQYTNMDNLWLEFEIDGETLMPRQKVTSVAFAQRAGNADMLGGLPASAFLQGQGDLQASDLPTNGLAQVSNNAIANEFSDVTWQWDSDDIDIPDYPGLGAQAVITTDETGTTYLTNLSIYTRFSLIASTDLTMVLIPPAGTGVGPIALIDSQGGDELSSDTYENWWTPGNTPELAPLIGAEVMGDWVLTITDVSEDLVGTTATGKLEDFQVLYDVVRSDEIDVNGDVNVAGNLHVEGLITGGGVERSGDHFEHWGRADCPAGMETLYTGMMIVNDSGHSGSADALCMAPGDPGPQTGASASEGYDLGYPARISNQTRVGFPSGNFNVKCAVCYTATRGPCFDIWGRQDCPTGFEPAYSGYGFGSHYTHAMAAQRVCVDSNFDTNVGGGGSGVLYPTFLWSNTGVSGSDYPGQRGIKCAKCCRQ